MPVQTTTQPKTIWLVNETVEVYCNGFVGYDSRPSDVTVQTETIERVWGRTPNYPALRRAKAQLPDLPYSYSRQVRSSAVVSYRPAPQSFPCSSGWDVGSRTRFYTKAPGSYIPPFGGDFRLSENSAISQLLNRARGAEWNAPVFFGEARETVQLVTRTARNLASSFRSLRRGDIIRAYRTLRMSDPTARVRQRFNRAYANDARKAAADHWLQIQYGWLPLLMDVKDAAEQLGEFSVADEVSHGRVTSRSQLDTRFDDVVAVEVSPPSTARRVAQQRESWRYTWVFLPTGLNDLGSIGLLNPLTVAWELCPLSFVVDWMFPIGRYLEQLDVPLRFTHAGGSKGYCRTVSSSFTNFIRDGVVGHGEYQTTSTLVTRDPLTSTPSLGLDSIMFDPNIGVRRMLSGLALASQAFRR